MKTLLACIASLLIGIIGTWFLMRPVFGDKEQGFYREVVSRRAKVHAEGVYSGASNAIHQSADWVAACRAMKPSPFREFAFSVAFSVRDAAAPQGAKEFLAQADAFMATYAARMP